MFKYRQGSAPLTEKASKKAKKGLTELRNRNIIEGERYPKGRTFHLIELGKHRKLTAAIAVILLLPLLLILWYGIQILSGASAFKGITEIRMVLPNGKEFQWKGEEDVSFYTGILNRSSVIDSPVREIESETPISLYLDQTEYQLYPSLSVSGCMAQTPEGRIRLLSAEDASAMLVRAELEYLYESYRLPTLTVCSGEYRYPVSPNDYTWSYKKADGIYYDDLLTETSEEVVSCNLFADFENNLSFSVQPSNYSLTVYGLINGEEGYELPVTSLAGLQFTQDTLLSVEISARWSQASNAEQYGEATYHFLALYDVPAQVEAIGAVNGEKTVEAGGYVLLRALYTNENEDLSVTTDLTEEPVKFYYDAASQSSYAAMPVTAETQPGSYTITVTSGETVRTVPVRVTEKSAGETRTYTVNDADYEAYLSPAQLESLDGMLRQLRLGSDGASHLQADLAFGEPVGGEVDLPFGSTVVIGNSAVEGSGMKTLEGVLYTASAGAEVRAVQSGVCIFTGSLGAFGNSVVIDHGCGIFSYYYHLSEISITTGDMVARSSSIGIVGNTGYTGGNTPVLHFALSVGDIYVCP